MGNGNGRPSPYEELKELQQAIRAERGRKPPTKDLLVLSPQNDPFYSGSEGEKKMAEWFAGLWERFGYTRGVHLRRIHYRIVAEGNILRYDGKPYENKTDSWKKLNDASRHARYLGMVDPTAIVDKRNPTPHVYLAPMEGTGPEWSYEMDADELDRIHPSLDNSWRNLLPEVEVEVLGYDYEEALQPYHVEVWAEKTTMDDILIPLCHRANVNYVSGAGYQSITTTLSLLGRISDLGKPCRILYVSDYDQAGQNMPRQVARQLEFWIERGGDAYGGSDVRLQPIVLTAEQAAGYPEDPETGAVELDAMEALDPGKLARVLREAVLEFRDETLRAEVSSRAEEAEVALDEAVAEVLAEEEERVEQIRAEAEEIYRRYRPELEDIANRLNAELKPLDERLETARHDIQERLDNLTPALPPLPEPEVDPNDEGWLYDSRRDYRSQLGHYDKHKGGSRQD